MKKLVLLVFVMITQLFALKEVDVKEIQNVDIFKKAGITVKKVMDADSLYLVNVKFPNGAPDTIYLTKDKKYIITGDAINTMDGSRLSMPVDMSALQGKQAFTFGSGKKELYLFTDTQCPYCKKFEAFFPQIEDKVKIHIFFFPLSRHLEAFDLSMYIMSKKTLKEKIDTFLTTSKDDKGFINRKIPKELEKELAAKVTEHIKLGEEVGVQGTPTLLDVNGNKVNWGQMLQEFGIQVR